MAEDRTKALGLLEQQLSELQRAFEQYFLGIERVSPVGDRDSLKKQLQKIRFDNRNASTAVKFRIGTLWNRFLSYDQMWNKTLRQIEDGTYKRDRNRAQKKAQKAGDEPAKKKPEAAGRRGPKPATLSDDQVQRIYDTYVLARRRTGESTRVSMDSLSSQLRKRAANMVDKHNCKGVEFKVVIKGGKALIKAQPKKP